MRVEGESWRIKAGKRAARMRSYFLAPALVNRVALAAWRHLKARSPEKAEIVRIDEESAVSRDLRQGRPARGDDG